MAVISSPTYDPTTTATNLANAYVAPTKALLDAQAAKAKATSGALSTLGSALSAFQTALSALSGGTKTVTANAATVSNTAVATATANSKAVAGTYSFYVEQLATAGQVSYNVADSVATNAGSLNIALADGSTFQVALTNADSDMDGKLTAKEIAAAVNVAATNNSRVTASTMTVNGVSKLVLTSTKTGADNAVASIDVAGLGDPALQADLSAQTVLSAASNAIVWIGGQNGTKIEQASNTITAIDDVSFTVTQAQAANAAPVTMTVAADKSGTAANVQSFVTAYNTLLGVMNTLTAAGDHTPVSGTDSTATSADAALHGDAGVASLRDRLNTALRAASGGQSLISFGISAGRDGMLSLDTNRLNKTVAANPAAIDTLFGHTAVNGGTGVMGTMNKLVSSWTNSANGLLSTRKSAATKQQSDVADRLVTVENQFNNAYKRYLAQFTALQSLQASMTSTSNMFTAMFSSDSNN
ncbi:flagellar hook-associated protein 2 [Duganella sp. 1411]|jgi:flagellar hook-associated protein 2|uniref:flagellar filament capping protein FliD n=1 Tax=Duganella sp. 1411 TaxID=2806572 RepID=UPI001AE4A781|nr:flagellar filament capping protein FliD [Duganella sp. 1411]MBP1203188.1 flagellar hook-associated protein 2 [Duganella sp. 1411]